MRRRITWLVAATTTAVVLTFVIPLCLLVKTLAEDRSMAAASQAARNVAIRISEQEAEDRLGDLIESVNIRTSNVVTSLHAPNGKVFGVTISGSLNSGEIGRARSGNAFQVIDEQGGRVYVPVVVPGGTYVVLSEVATVDLDKGVISAWIAIIGVGLGLTLGSLLIAYQFGSAITEPLLNVADTAHKIREGDLGARAEAYGTAETIELGEALNSLADRISELLAAERAAVGDLAHRLRTPVTALRLDTEAVADPEVADRLQTHIENVQRTVDAIVKEARRPIRDDLSAGSDATAVVRERIAFWSALAEDQERNLRVYLPSTPLHVSVGVRDLQDVVDVLVDNVFAHTPEGVGLTVVLTTDSGRVALEVSDEGPGFPLETEEPEPDDGERFGFTGLGLDIVRRTAESAGGRMDKSKPGEPGGRVRVLLPLLAKPGASTPIKTGAEV